MTWGICNPNPMQSAEFEDARVTSHGKAVHFFEEDILHRTLHHIGLLSSTDVHL
jgi:hypothetical protein